MSNVKIARIGVLATYAALILLLVLQTFASGGPETQGTSLLAPILIGLAKSLPLLIFIPWLISGSHRAASWLSYCVMFYFILAVLLLFTSGSGPWGGLMMFDTIALFVFTVLYTRWKKAEERNVQN